MKKNTFLFLVAIIVFFASCRMPSQNDNTTPGAPTIQELFNVSYELDDDVEEFNASKIFVTDDLSSETTVITVEDDDVQSGEYEIGNVLYIKDPNNEGDAIKKITGVTNTPSGVIIETENALVSEAFDSLSIHVISNLGSNDSYRVKTEDGVTFEGVYTKNEQTKAWEIIDSEDNPCDDVPSNVQNYFGFKLEDYVIYSIDGDDITIDGLLYVAITSDFMAEINGENLEEFKYILTGTQYLELSKDLDFQLDNGLKNREIPLGEIFFPIPGCPVATMGIELFIGFDATANANLKTGFTEESNVTVGIEYDGTSWSDIHNNHFDIDIMPFEFTGNASFRPYIGFSAGFDLLRIVGAEFVFELYTKIEATCNSSIHITNYEDSFLESLNVDATINAVNGLSIDVATDFGALGLFIDDFSYEIARFEETLFEYSYNGNDTTTPTITSTVPEIGATGIDPNILEIVVNFNEPMDTTRISMTTHNRTYIQREWIDNQTLVCHVTQTLPTMEEVGFTLNPSNHEPGLFDIAGNPLPETEILFTTGGQRIPTRTITIDGYNTDWTGIEPQIVDDIGDLNDQFPLESEYDIEAIYLAKDNEFLYFRVDTVLPILTPSSQNDVATFWMFLSPDNERKSPSDFETTISSLSFRLWERYSNGDQFPCILFSRPNDNLGLQLPDDFCVIESVLEFKVDINEVADSFYLNSQFFISNGGPDDTDDTYNYFELR